MVVEELCIRVGPAERAAFVEADARVWTAFLRTCEGFVDKQVWLDPERPDEVRLVIWWESLAHWHAVTRDRVEAVDGEMGAMARPVVSVRSIEVVGGVR